MRRVLIGFILGAGLLTPAFLALLAFHQLDVPPPNDIDRDRVVTELNELSGWVGFEAKFSRRGEVLVMDGADFCGEDTIQRLPVGFGPLPVKAGFKWFVCYDGSRTVVVEVKR